MEKQHGDMSGGRVVCRLIVLFAAAVAATGLSQGEETSQAKPCSVRVIGGRVTLEAPAFAFTLDISDGLRAASWENRLTGRKLDLGDGAEVEFDIGLPGQPLETPKMRVVKTPPPVAAGACEAVFQLAADHPKLSATATYRLDSSQPVLRKFVTIANHSGRQWNRLLNVRLGGYKTDAKTESGDPDYPAFLESRIDDLAGQTRGFPAYVERQFFISLAHPAGFATRRDRELSLRQLPGVKLAAGASFECMEAVYGASREGQARRAFCDHLQSRMRRVLRGHDKPLAILEPFGAKPDGDFWETEDFLLDNIAKVAAGQRDSRLHWDYYSIDFWHDPKGDLKTPDAGRFPNGFTQILPELRRLGVSPGLWVDSGNWGTWTIGDNPALARAAAAGAGPNQRGICRATEPANRFYIEGYAHQLRANGVRLVKFDNALLQCDNSAHDHPPGEYSFEPIENALIEFYRVLDRECPDVFIMLYWHYQSPWWLQYADTVYDIGMHMEGASFSTFPALRARDSVTRRLDAGRWMLKDWPPLGWDTLGVWLSDWPWNSRIGKEAWQGGVIMDISRGHLLAQLWSDTAYLTPDQRRQMADFVAMLKAQPDCFRNSRFVLGNPWKNEPYGYCCSNGRRAFLAINNGVWRDSSLTLQLNSAWGLPNGSRWDLYRWWPDPAKLGGAHGSNPAIALRPFDIVLLEAVPAGEPPTLNHKFQQQPIPTGFGEPSRELPITVAKPDEFKAGDAVVWTLLEPSDFRSAGGAKLTKQADGSLLASGANPLRDSYVIKAVGALNAVTAIRLEALPDDSLPHNGPGRAVNGNFTLAEFSLSVGGQPVRLARARADFSQTSHGGWPVEAALDGKPQTGWGIDPAEGMRHAAVFELERPFSRPQGAVLEFRLDHAGRQHNIGRLRLSATSAKPPIPVPASETRFIVRGAAPPTKTGGFLAVADAFHLQANRHWTRNCNTGFAIEAALAGKPAAFEPVVNNGNYAAPWQTWRLAVPPSVTPQPFELRITSSLPTNVEHRFSAHFVVR